MEDNIVKHDCTEKATKKNLNQCSKLNEAMKVNRLMLMQ